MTRKRRWGISRKCFAVKHNECDGSIICAYAPKVRDCECACHRVLPDFEGDKKVVTQHD